MAQPRGTKAVKEPTAKTPSKLTNKQRKIIKAVGSGKTQKQAAKYAEVSETYVSTVLKKVEVIESLQEMMKKHGLDDATLLGVHADMIQATKTISVVSGKDASSGTMDFVDIPDWQARGKGLEMAYKLTGAFVEKKEITFPDGIKLNISFKSP